MYLLIIVYTFSDNYCVNKRPEELRQVKHWQLTCWSHDEPPEQLNNAILKILSDVRTWNLQRTNKSPILFHCR